MKEGSCWFGSPTLKSLKITNYNFAKYMLGVYCKFTLNDLQHRMDWRGHSASFAC